MRGMVAIQAGALALLAGPALSGPFHHGGCCSTADCPQPQYRLKAEVEERVCTVEVPVRNPVVVRTTVTEKDAPCTRLVPACGGPHCGTQTELRAQTVPGKVRHISIEVNPPEKEWGTRKEDKVERCVTITIQRLPDVVPTPAPRPAGPAR